MDAQRHQKISELFQAVCDLPPEQQDSYLHTACDGDDELQREVQAMLDLDESGGDALSDTSLDAGSQFRTDPKGPAPSPAAAGMPETIGQYTLQGIIGRGGMGTVYKARQDDLNRSVALKVLRPEGTSPESLRRFQIEAQVLGQLSHPGIARIYDTGTFDAGFGAQPWFAMELIQGKSITAYAKEHDLDVPAQLELMITVCEAVHHAHQKGVVHRDLKPENILVDEQGQPRVLDFGVARVTNSDLQTATINTRVGQLIGTIPYMSPEQVAGDSRLIDARCDVYALGVVLFELLTGRLPHDLLDKPIPEAVRAIRDEEPLSLSTINNSFRGDLDTILAKSLEKELDRRYQSASEFAGDLRHFLRNEPIMARPASTLYQLRKFTRRNRILVGATALIMLLLVAGIVGTSLGLSRAIEARADAQASEQQAQTELAKSRQVTSFLRQLLTGIEPEIARGRDVTVLRTILDDAVRNIDTELVGQGEVEAQLRNTIGETYRKIGIYDQAETQLSRALELFEQLNQKNSPLWFETGYNLARLHLDQGQADEALAIFQEHLDRHIQEHGRNHPSSIRDSLGILRVYQYQYEWGKLDEGASLWLPIARETLGDEHQDSISILKILADAKNFLGHQDEAVKLYEEVLRFERSHLGDDHPRTMFSIRGLASCYRRLGRLDEAEPLYREFVAHCLSVYGSEHKTTADARNSLALLLKNQRRYDEAEALYLMVLEFNQRELGDQHQYTLITMYNLAGVYQELKRFEDAGKLLRARIRILSDQYEPTHSQVLLARINLAIFLRNSEEVEASLKEFEDVIVSARGAENFDRSFLGYFLLQYGQTLFQRDHFADSEKALLESWDLMVEAFTPQHAQSHDAALSLLKLYEKWDRPEKATHWRSTARSIGAPLPAETSSP